MEDCEGNIHYVIAKRVMGHAEDNLAQVAIEIRDLASACVATTRDAMATPTPESAAACCFAAGQLFSGEGRERIRLAEKNGAGPIMEYGHLASAAYYLSKPELQERGEISLRCADRILRAVKP